MAEDNATNVPEDASDTPLQGIPPGASINSGAPAPIPEAPRPTDLPLSNPPSELAAEVGLVRPAPSPKVPPMSEEALAKPPKNLESDIQKILEEVKLPERRAPEVKAPAAGPALTRTAAPETPQPPAPPAPPSNAPIGSVRTLKQDLQEVVRDQKISLVHAVTLEQEKRRIPESIQVETSTQHPKLTGIIFSIVLLLALGAASLGGVYFVMTGAADRTSAVDDSIVFAEQSVPLPIDGQAAGTLKQTLATARGSARGALGSITQIIPTRVVAGSDGTESAYPASLTDFWGAIGASAPPELLRALSPQFFFGIHTVDENAPVFVIPVVSYDRAFAAMLEWEKSMNADLAPIFTMVPSLTLGSDGIPTERVFSDVVMRNYDVRVLKDDAGVIQLYYSFPTRDLLIIAESPYTFTELLSRLQAERRL